MRASSASAFRRIWSVLSAGVVLSGLSAGAAAQPGTPSAPSGPSVVKVVQAQGKSRLLVNGKSYFIRGAGGGGSKALLAECGGNSFRTWGVGPETSKELDEAQRLGLTVAVGIWLGHKDQGFRYDDPASVRKQAEDVRRAVLKYKGHPAVLAWGLGNEMEMGGDTPAPWAALEDLAKMVHQLDPNHPTMTVVAEIGGGKVQELQRLCPSIDIVGVNTYGGGATLAERYRKAGGTKPYVITEFGPPGTWEIKLNRYGAAPELTSTEKARRYRETYVKSVQGAADLCLGSYAFIWGHKFEATATWFGMLLPDGSRLAAVDTMQELWSGTRPAHPCPVIGKLALTGSDQVSKGEMVSAEVAAQDPSGDPLRIAWTLRPEQGSYAAQGSGAEALPEDFKEIQQDGQYKATMRVPRFGGIYRLYCIVRNAHGGAATGSLPIKVEGPPARFVAPALEMPVVLAGEDAKGLYVPSGWMGDTKAIGMDADCPDSPHHGASCLKVTFDQPGGWGGVVWQDPPNDWGDKPGGYDLGAAKKLTFWARGREGTEKVKFGFGLIGIEKKYHDSGKAEIEVTLTKDWQQYAIDLAPYDLSCVKSGFRWSLAGQGRAVTFYLSDVRYE